MAVTVTDNTNTQIGQNVPQLQSYQAQSAPELKSYQAQSTPELQSYQAQEVPTLQSYQAQDIPQLRSYQAQEIPILQAYQAQVAPELRSYQAPVERVNDVYDRAINAQRLALENQYNLSRAAAEHSAEQIPEYYQQQMRQASTTAARNQQAFNESAAGSGLNVGAGSQARLAQNNALQNNLSSIGTAQANAQAEVQFQLMQLEQQYQNAIAEAVANNEYERAAALLQEYRQEQESAVSVYNQRALLGFEEQQKAAQSAADVANQGAILGFQERQAAEKSAADIANQQALLGLQERQTAAQSAADIANQMALLGLEERQSAAKSAADIANQRALLGFQENQTAQQSAVDAANQRALLDYQEMLEAARSAQETANRQAELNSNALADRAALLAQYGDFSGYAQLYGRDAAAQMAAVWARQNPGIAYSMGLIDGNTYAVLTGEYPTGYTGGSTGSYSGGPGSPDNGDNDKSNSTGGNLTGSQRQMLIGYLAAQAAGNYDYMANLLSYNPDNLSLQSDASAVLNAVAEGANLTSLTHAERAQAQQILNNYRQVTAANQPQTVAARPGTSYDPNVYQQQTANVLGATVPVTASPAEREAFLDAANSNTNLWTTMGNGVDRFFDNSANALASALDWLEGKG